MSRLAKVIYILLENPDKKVNDFSLEISQDEEFDNISQYFPFFRDYGNINKKEFIEKIVGCVRLEESQKYSNFDLFVIKDKLEIRIEKLEKQLRQIPGGYFF